MAQILKPKSDYAGALDRPAKYDFHGYACSRASILDNAGSISSAIHDRS
jgi:hypothetical protein